MTYGIVICSYKYGHLAAHSIESVLSQTRPFDKIWFVDDGAEDCNHLQSLYPHVEFILRKENLGIIANFNNMLSRVDTDYVMFLGADNWLTSNALQLLSNKIIKDSTIDIIVYDIIVTGELKEELMEVHYLTLHESGGDYYWNRQGVHHGSMLYRTELGKKVGGYAHNGTSPRTDEDLNLWNKMLNEVVNVKHIHQALLYYRRHKLNYNKI